MVQKLMERVWSVKKYWSKVLLLISVSVNKYGVKCVASLRFWENKGWIHEIGPYGYLGVG